MQFNYDFKNAWLIFLCIILFISYSASSSYYRLQFIDYEEKGT